MFFFLFNIVASVDYIYLWAGRVGPKGGCGVKANLIFFARGGGVGGLKQICTEKWGWSRNFFFLYNHRLDYFFFQMGG